MPHYPLYLESGPKRRKTMVHVLDLLGCVATGPTTDAALEATPDTIRAHLRFLRRYNEPADPDAPFTTAVAEHITQGEWLGNGSPYLVFAPDLKPVTDAEIETLLRRFHGLTEELASWAAAQTPKQLDAPPEDGGRTARAILLHVLAPVGGVLSAALGGATGFSRVAGAAERGEMPVVDALRLLDAMAAERVRATTPEERTFVRQRPPPRSTPRRSGRSARRSAARWSTTGSTWPSCPGGRAARRCRPRTKTCYATCQHLVPSPHLPSPHLPLSQAKGH